MTFTTVEIIQAMLAPGIMISACGLLILGMNNKYSLIVNRIRLLDDEKRKHKKENPADEDNNQRIFSINLQTKKLNIRLRHVRNAVFSYSLAVGLYIVASLFIGLRIVYDTDALSNVAIIFFLLGMISVLCGIVFAATEVMKGYKIVQIELEGEKN
ncbi:MAG: DUF2721 domain-containing protein [Bacteroidota bacterium]